MGRTTHDFLHDTQSISNSSFTPQPPHHQASKATFSALLDGNVLVGLYAVAELERFITVRSTMFFGTEPC